MRTVTRLRFGQPVEVQVNDAPCINRHTLGIRYCTARDCANTVRPWQTVCDSCRRRFIADADSRQQMIDAGVVPD